MCDEYAAADEDAASRPQTREVTMSVAYLNVTVQASRHIPEVIC